ncbi:MAG: VCBS repeat-containing protein, partial [Bacteroidales bacterium]|nr:VCBS repeat-containing protein [Bacteroidales bacterium]
MDYPALVDVDGDGALDVLNFWVPSTGDYLHYYRNHALETYGTLDSFDLRIEDWSWGCFAENEESNGIYLDSCRPADGRTTEAKVAAGKAHEPKHSGSTICALPRPTAAGPVYDLLLGDVGYDGLMYLHNGGTPDRARITAYDSLFPAAEPVRLASMPVASVLPPGVAAVMGWDTAARTHVCVSPYHTDAFSTQGRESLWIYELDASSGTALTARRLRTDFLQADMLDAGALSCPAWFDYNGDGLLDLVVGYAGEPAGVTEAEGTAASGHHGGGLALYENTGTATAPAFRFVTDDFLALKQEGLCLRALSPAFGDYDGDGKPELVLGTFEG